jgi:hypothetical protein
LRAAEPPRGACPRFSSRNRPESVSFRKQLEMSVA